LDHLTVTGNLEDGVIPLEKVRSKQMDSSEFTPKLWNMLEELIEEDVSKGLYE
jgi:hypothetical protein